MPSILLSGSCINVLQTTCYKRVSYSESARLCGLDRRPDGFRTDAHLSQSCPPNPVSVICLSKLQPGSQNCHKPATPALTYRESSCISSGSLQFPPRWCITYPLFEWPCWIIDIVRGRRQSFAWNIRLRWWMLLELFAKNGRIRELLRG